MTDKTFRAKIRQYNELHSQIAELTAQADKLKDSIKDEMQARSLEEYKAGAVMVRCKEVVSPRFDSVAFKAVYSDLYSKYAKPSASVRLTVVNA